MKILKIKSLNINSLKGEFEIDFEAFLKDESLFAITGPTGSGKSTVLDIITCALYGRTARLSNPNELMSRNTGESFCEVEFEIKGKIYRSSWGVNRARKSADGKFQQAKMEIVDVKSSKVLESYLSKVPKVVEELSGLDFDRFSRSMMLAQGGFDAFLKSDVNDRSTLLEKITGTQIYKQISQEIFETCSTHKKAIELDENSLGSIELLEKEVVEVKTKALNESKKQKLEKDKQELELLKISSWLENLQKLEQDNIKYTQEFAQIAQEKEQKNEEFLKLELANKALRIQPIHQEKNQTTKTITQDKEKLETLIKEHEELKKQNQLKSAEFNTVKEQFEKEKISYKLNTNKLKEISILQTQIKSYEASFIEKDKKKLQQKEVLSKLFELNIEILLNDETQLQSHHQNFSNAIKTSKQELEKLLSEYIPLEEQTKELKVKENQTRAKLKESEQLLKAVLDYENLQTQIQQEHTKISEITTQIEMQTKLNNEKIKLISQIQETLLYLKQTREKELLIKNYKQDRVKLQDGQECFLCGSKEHPYIKHSLSVDIDKTTAKIEEQEHYLENEIKALNNDQINLAKLSTKLESSKEEVEKEQSAQNLIKEFFKTSGFTIKDDSKLILQEQNLKCEQELKEYVYLREQKEKVQIQKENLQTTVNKQEQKEQQIQVCIKLIEELKQEQKNLNNEILTLQAKNKSILDIQDLNAFEQMIQKTMDSVVDRYNNLQNELTSLKSKDESISKQTEQLTQKQTQDMQTLQTLQTQFEKALEEYGFTSCEEFEKAHLEKEPFEQLVLFCKNIEERYAQTLTLKNDTTKKLQEQKELKLSNRELIKVNEELKELQTTIDELQKSIGSIEKELEINAQNIKKHEDKIKELQKKKEAFKVWVKLNDMIGSASGDKFAKFAQGITLDQLIYLANKHLNILSPRYELQRSLDSNKQLEIEIVDGFQGDVVRGVNTLSGGESFIVSLSLALGLSSLASQKISIDSLFLDEGFGTLDSDSLELALNALNQLQSSGKMVGVISHVEALKERIPLQIRVVPRGDGTSLLSLNN
ncbi:MAG: SbcC/MukB-like Walker B domain-containing protein [Arcobacteraceae bacterium]